MKSLAQKIVRKSIRNIRQDFSDWNAAIVQASNPDYPSRVKLMAVYRNISADALLSSQIENRFLQSMSTPFLIFKGDKENPQLSETLANQPEFRKLFRFILEAELYGYSLIELSLIKPKNNLHVELIPRQNVVPDNGRFYQDISRQNFENYRDLREYGVWLLEFISDTDFGTLNKAIPHILIKKFAQSCWSELCEIYGVPPRILKTNTENPEMLAKAQSLMANAGTNQSWIIDETESLEFAKSDASTSGELYKSLIDLCNNEISMLISGAIIGQDTAHGNESKETISVQQLQRLVDADKDLLQRRINTTVLPALAKIGIIPNDCSLFFQSDEDIESLWNKTAASMPYYNFDPKWLNDKFGLKIVSQRNDQFGLSAHNHDFFL
jgi:hypothetical protein